MAVKRRKKAVPAPKKRKRPVVPKKPKKVNLPKRRPIAKMIPKKVIKKPSKPIPKKHPIPKKTPRKVVKKPSKPILKKRPIPKKTPKKVSRPTAKRAKKPSRSLPKKRDIPPPAKRRPAKAEVPPRRKKSVSRRVKRQIHAIDSLRQPAPIELPKRGKRPLSKANRALQRKIGALQKIIDENKQRLANQKRARTLETKKLQIDRANDRAEIRQLKEYLVQINSEFEKTKEGFLEMKQQDEEKMELLRMNIAQSNILAESLNRPEGQSNRDYAKQMVKAVDETGMDIEYYARYVAERAGVTLKEVYKMHHSPDAI